MTQRLFLVPPDALGSGQPGSLVVVTGPEGRHAGSVVRLSAGEAVLLGDGAGRRALAEVVASDRHTLTARVLQLQTQPRPAAHYVLVQALAKGGRDEAAIEAATELGVDAVVPWQAARSVVSWRGERAAKGRSRWQSLVAAATKQSRRFYVPDVGPVADQHDVQRLVSEAALGLVLDPQGSMPIGSVVPPTCGTVVVVVGPEGGLDDAELSGLSAAGGVAVRLGAELLRTSTAGPAALAVLSARSRWR
ncbi:MAG: 16S rRNA (uracil(1498)-N(3))-methyltransferase [Dermatophilaceae bacterium]